MLLRAFAKINLSLRILGRRPDGYHEVRTVLQTVDWWDEIHMDPAEHFHFWGPGTPADETNLVIRAVRAYERLTGVNVRVRIGLIKQIPIGRGLGGGSADAAVTLMGLQRIYKKTMDASDVLNELQGLGADVPFFAIGGMAEGFGRGDQVVRIEDDPRYWLLLVDPGIVVPRAEAYSWLTLPAGSNSIESLQPQCVSAHEPDKRSECEPDRAKSESDEWRNDFEAPVFERYPELADIKRELVRLGAYRAALSGSGSAVFGQFQTEKEAVQAGSALDQRFRVKVTKPLPRSEYFQRMVEE